MEKYLNILCRTYFDNSLWQYCSFAIILVVGFIFKRLLSKLTSRLLFKLFQNHAPDFSQKDLYVLLKKPIDFLLMLIFIFLSFNQLNYPSFLNLVPSNEFGLKMIIEKGYMLVFIISLMNVVRKMLDFMGIIMLKRAENKDKKSEKQIIPFTIEVLKMIVIIFGLFIIMGSVFHINVGTLIAGLGIGGLAVALAAKESLENLISSFTIFADKPFVTGDFVKVGNIQGVVEKVGFRSTRLRTLDKSFVTVPNKLMVDSEVDNMSERALNRINFNISLKYNTTSEQLKFIMKEIKNCIVSHPDTVDDCYVKFVEFGNSSLNIMIIFFIEGNDYTRFLDVKEDINFKIMQIVHQNECDFALPSTSVYMEK